jgi:hypothetical protein
MSIDAVVKTVIINEDGSGELQLIDRPARRGQNDGIKGQASLHFDHHPEEVTALNWLPIWGGAGEIMLGDRKIAIRQGYTWIKFVDRDKFVSAIVEYNQRHQNNFT